MKKTKLLFITMCLSWFMSGVNAQQDTIRSLIFSEWRGGQGLGDNYIELANMGGDSLDLSRFLIQWINGNGSQLYWENDQWRFPKPAANGRFYLPAVKLAPGKTYLIANQQGSPREDLIAIADTTVRASSPFKNLMFNYGTHCNVLYYFLDNGDSIIVDVVNLEVNDNLQTVNILSDVAGVPECTRDYTLVRKASIKQGNVNWLNSKGISFEDSEWMPILSQLPESRVSFTTPGVHGNFDISLESGDVDIDIANATMSVPWGIYKGDSLLSHLTIGPGMAWQYIPDSTNIAKSSHTINQNGDMWKVYAAGNTLKQTDFKLSVKEAAVDQASVFPMLYKGKNGTWVQPYSINNKLYLVDTIGYYTDTTGYITDTINSVIDTIGFVIDTIGPILDTLGRALDRIENVAYATRVDTLFRYMEKAPKATWEIVWVDNTQRADLKKGDILRVAAEDGVTVKDYDIGILDYQPSTNVFLGAITWPDKTEFLENWKHDTIPQFDPNKTIYTILLPYGSKNVPALVAHPQDVNARVEITRAVTLTGSLENRTTMFNVMSENPSDSLNKVYSVIFEVEKDPSKIQDYEGTPFISEFVTTQFTWIGYLEIVNPGTKPLDLSEYIIVKGYNVIPGADMASLIPKLPTQSDFQNRYRGYVPGYKFFDDTTSWLLNPGTLSLDAAINPLVEPGDVFVLSSASSARGFNQTPTDLANIDKRWLAELDRDDLGVNVKNTPGLLVRGAKSVYLWKIENDSVLEGKKPVGDPNDYTLVDMVGDPINDNIWPIAGISIGDVTRVSTRRKPNIYKGVSHPIESMEAFGTDAETSDWIVDRYTTANNAQMSQYIGSHIMDIVTVYISKVTSPIYLVSDGYKGVQSIQGDLTSTTVSGFFGNVTKADTAQVLSLHSGVNGSVKSEGDPVAGNDTLIVVSADGLNTTTYVLINLPIDNSAQLILVDTNAGLTINSLTDSTGSITGVVYGSLLKDVTAAVKTLSDNAVMNIINGEGNLIPLQLMDNNLMKVYTKVGNDIYFEVTAQDQVTVITYKLEPASLSSDAFVISSLYNVDQDNNLIEGLADGTALVTFNKNIEVVKGATNKVLNKLGQERMDGQLAYDDVLQVVSEDGTVTRTYFIAFMNENTPDSNGAPEISLAFSDSTIAVPGTLMLSATAKDDGLPPPANLTYLWELTSGNAANVVIEHADELETNVTFATNADYTLTLSVSDGALTSKATVTVTVGIVGVRNNIMPTLRMYPNPAKNKLNLELINMPEQTSVVSIFNVTGSIVYNTKLSTEMNEIDISGFDSGLYLIKIDSGNRSLTQRFQIQN